MEDPTTGPAKLLSVAATQKLLGIGRTTLYALIKRGALRPVKLGRRTLFFTSEIEVFVAALPRRGPQDRDGQQDSAAQEPCSSSDDEATLSAADSDQPQPVAHGIRPGDVSRRARP